MPACKNVTAKFAEYGYPFTGLQSAAFILRRRNRASLQMQKGCFYGSPQIPEKYNGHRTKAALCPL
jgi:hypothetical protein